MRFLFLIFTLYPIPFTLYPLFAEEASIDLSASVEPTYFSWNEISNDTKPPVFGYFTQRSALNLKISENPWVLNLRLDNISLAAENELPRYLNHIATRYPRPGPQIFLSQAYIDYLGLIDSRDFRFEMGLMPFYFGKGLVLSDNGLGIMGARLTMNSLGPVDVELSAANTALSSTQENTLFVLTKASVMGMGKWQLAFMPEIDTTPRTLNLGATAGKIRRNNVLVSYYQSVGQNYFLSAETVFSQGSYFLANTAPTQKVETKTNAFVIEGGWKAKIPKVERLLGTLDFRFLYASGSGNNPTTARDEAFFAPNAHRFNGLSRLGWGQYLGATGFDVLGSSATYNGMPAGLSGVTVYGTYLKSKTFKALNLPYRLQTSYLKFRATESQSLSRDLGTEWTLGAQTETNQRFSGEINYFRFSPGNAYQVNNQKAQNVNGLKLLLTLSFL